MDDVSALDGLVDFIGEVEALTIKVGNAIANLPVTVFGSLYAPVLGVGQAMSRGYSFLEGAAEDFRYGGRAVVDRGPFAQHHQCLGACDRARQRWGLHGTITPPPRVSVRT